MSELDALERWPMKRPAGEVTLRWLDSGSDTKMRFKRRRIASAIAQAAERWFASNHCPDRIVVLLVIERDGKEMTDAEAAEYIRERLSIREAIGQWGPRA